VPLKDDIDAYFEREVHPHVPDAWMDRSKDKVGYEINFNRHFYKYTPPRPREEIDAELKKAEEEILRLLREVRRDVVSKLPAKVPHALVPPVMHFGSEVQGTISSRAVPTEDRNAVQTYSEEPSSSLARCSICERARLDATGQLAILCVKIRLGRSRRPSTASTSCNLAGFLATFSNFARCSISMRRSCGAVLIALTSTIQVAVPPPRQQRAIADYLDRETARLDALVAAKERVLGLLAEKRRALITRAVTRGLDPRAPLRDSGIPWLGEIPAVGAPPYARLQVQREMPERRQEASPVSQKHGCRGERQYVDLPRWTSMKTTALYACGQATPCL
jgi:hypothetical protein